MGWTAAEARLAMTKPDNEAWPRKLPSEVEVFVRETVEMIHELDDTVLQEMTPPF